MPSKEASVIIVGAGVFGLTLAHELCQRGYTQVTVLDRHPPRVPDGSSVDISHIIRSDYADAQYMKMAVEATAGWKSEYSQYYHESGLLIISGKGGISYLSQGTRSAIRIVYMSEKYDGLDPEDKYDFSPSQLFSFPSTPPSSTSSIRNLQRPDISPVSPPTTMSSEPTYHRVPAEPPRHSTDSDDSISPAARLVSASPHLPENARSITFYPTNVLRFIILWLLFTSVQLLIVEGPARSVPIFIMAPVAFLRTLQVASFYHTPLTAHWWGWRGLNLLLDAAIVGSLIGGTVVSFLVRNRYYSYWVHQNGPGCITAWVASLLYIFASLDTGSPTRFEVKVVSKVTSRLDLRGGNRAISLRSRDLEAAGVIRRPEMGPL
ncbi:hypothetical protein V492_06245 [Pseudogymnoascus sp. VKM F-4246]|nr:hypothetical protein V492_06245 [Pseudogymnoascus sp. VKM F-4246]